MIRVMAVLAFAGCCMAQQPRITNARLESRAAAGGLDAAVRGIASAAADPVWIGYTVPIATGDHHMCGWQQQGKLMLEGAKELFVLYRVEQHEVKRLRLATEDCEIDGGGLPVYWLSGVRPADSVAYLKSLLNRDPSLNPLHAIALHNDPAATAALIAVVQEDKSASLRKQAMSLLGRSKDPRATEFFGKILSR